jgi:hypothetical protein
MADVGRRNERTSRAYASVALTDNVQKLARGNEHVYFTSLHARPDRRGRSIGA